MFVNLPNRNKERATMRAFAVNFARAGAMRLNHGYAALIFTMLLTLGGAFPAQAADVNLLGAYCFETVINVSESEREAWNRE
jgi:hypothetical protein